MSWINDLVFMSKNDFFCTNTCRTMFIDSNISLNLWNRNYFKSFKIEGFVIVLYLKRVVTERHTRFTWSKYTKHAHRWFVESTGYDACDVLISSILIIFWSLPLGIIRNSCLDVFLTLDLPLTCWTGDTIFV